MILGNFTLWKFPRGIAWFLGKQTNKPLKNGGRQIILLLLCFVCQVELTDKDRRHEVRACHELCELLKTENTLVPLHCFIVTKVWTLIFKNIFVFLNVLSIKSSNWYYLGLCCYRCVWFGFLYWWFLCRTSQLGFQELAFIWLTAFSWVKITEEVISDNKDFFV